jgi:hypothetical protein
VNQLLHSLRIFSETLHLRYVDNAMGFIQGVYLSKKGKLSSKECETFSYPTQSRMSSFYDCLNFAAIFDISVTDLR